MSSKPSLSELSSRLSKLGITGAAPVVATSPETQPVTPEESLVFSSLDEIDSAEKLARHLHFLADFNKECRLASLRLIEELAVGESQTDFASIYGRVQRSFPPLASGVADDSELNRLCMRFSESAEVQSAAEEFLSSQAGQVSETDRSASANLTAVSVGTVVEVHEFMNVEFGSLIANLAALPETERFVFEPRLVETVAEIAVTLAVRRKFAVTTEQMELASEEHQSVLEKNKRFLKATEQLAVNMKNLHSVLRPRLSAEALLAALNAVRANAEEVKSIAKRARFLEGDEVGSLIEQFVHLTRNSDSNQLVRSISNPFEARELFERHLARLADTSPTSASSLREAWEKSQLDLAIFMQAILMMQQDPSLPLPPPPALGNRRLPDAKEVVKMQSFMVEELKTVKALLEAQADGDRFDSHTLVAFAQAVASAGMEQKFGFAAEDLTLAGFKNGPKLANDQKFMQISMAQQQILGEIAELGGEVPGASPAAPAGCALM